MTTTETAAKIAWMAQNCISSSDSSARSEGRIALADLDREMKRHEEALEVILQVLDIEGFRRLQR